LELKYQLNFPILYNIWEDLVRFSRNIVASDDICAAGSNGRVTNGAFVGNLRLIELFFIIKHDIFVKLVCAAQYVEMEQVSA
jgi:hypothetical protein